MRRIKKWCKIIGCLLGGLCLLLLLTQAFLLRGTPGRPLYSSDLQKGVIYSRVPTLLIPGWGGNMVTYNHLIKYYQQRHWAQKVMTVWVSPHNHIRVSGSWHGQRNALIQVLFDWNYSATYHPQVKELRHVLRFLHHRYHLQQTNVIAHSYGGTEFIHAYMGAKDLQRNLRLSKIVFLGVPVEESLSDRLSYHYLLIHQSKDRNFQRLYKQMKEWRLDYPLEIDNLMGSKDGSKITDGAVPHIQSEMLRALIKAHPLISYHQKIYRHTTHTQLHQRTLILNDIKDILWKGKN